MHRIVDQFGRPYPKAKAPERRPLAVAPYLDSWREYAAAGLTPRKLAAMFVSADGGDVRQQAELFEQIEERDGHLIGETSKRKNVILAVDFTVAPATDDARDARVADFVREFIDGVTDWEDCLVSLQDAVGKGYSALEIDWDVSSGQALPSSLEFVEQKRLLFTDPKGYVRKTPVLMSDENPMGDEIPAWKVLFHRYGGKSGHPTRSGIYRVCAWWFLFKNYAIKDWVTFCEVYGMPLRLGKYDSGASDEDRAALYAAISSLGSDAAGVISKATEIEFVETVRGTATGDLYKALAEFGNREVSKALLGQTLSAEVGGGGSYAAAKTHEGVRLDLLKADSRAIASTVRSQLIRPIVGFNFGWDTPVPKYEAPWEETEDLNNKALWIVKMLDRGLEMPVPWLRKEFKIPEPKQGEAVIHIEPASPTRMAKMIVAKQMPTGGADASDALADRLEAEADPMMTALLEPVRRLVESAQSLEEIRDGLAGLFPDMAPEALSGLFAQAMAAANLAGSYTADNGAEG